MLGTREPAVYGSATLDDVKKKTEDEVGSQYKLEWYQSNIEGEIVSRIQQANSQNFDGIIINPGGYSHTSVAIHDALKILKIPVIEVHLTNVHTREEFRHTLLTAKAVKAIMGGFGIDVYHMAIKGLLHVSNN
jgi:3-dehydroquinate dehydratase-2